MILIADSGSSKTDWVSIDTSLKINHYQSPGINPFFTSSDDIYEIIETTFSTFRIEGKIKKVYFYGTGCIRNQNTNVVFDGLKQFFTNAEIIIEDDMFGAARSLLGNSRGIACILGTGANSCKYDGKEIIEKIPALGYILGDEASGAYFGKILINNYFKKIMPSDISAAFRQKYQPEVGDVLNKVYKQQYPNRFLANYAHFLSEHLQHAYIQNLISEGFEAFITRNIIKYTDYQDFQIGFAGSIAFHFSEILLKIGRKYNLVIGKIIEKPIEGLIQYHQQNK